MVNTKKTVSTLTFFYLALFPLGQLLRFSLEVLGVRVTFLAVDLIVTIVGVYFVRHFGIRKLIKASPVLQSLLVIGIFGLALSLTLFEPLKVVLNSLYLVRVVFYVIFSLVIYHTFKTKKEKVLLFNSLIAVIFASSLLGLIQYFFYPDLRAFKVFGWDDHLYRLAGTFLDPGFTGMIIVFGFLLTLLKYLETKRKVLGLILLVFFSSLALTYSRASYLALLAGLVGLAAIKPKLGKWFLALALVFFLTLGFLPRTEGVGVLLERTFSILLRIENYQDGLFLFAKQPLFGVGFNNVCLAKARYLGEANHLSHSCPGLDASPLFLLVTTGIVGAMTFFWHMTRAYRGVKKDLFGQAFLLTSGALFTHSLFLNSLFYPFVLGLVAVLAALARD